MAISQEPSSLTEAIFVGNLGLPRPFSWEFRLIFTTVFRSETLKDCIIRLLATVQYSGLFEMSFTVVSTSCQRLQHRNNKHYFLRVSLRVMYVSCK